VSVSAVPLHLRSGVKEHFLGDLRTKRPDLAAELERRYRGAYLSRREQAEVVAPVHRAVARLRPDTPPSRQWHPALGPQAPEAPQTEQLRFGA
jgi:hypothetical protein